MCTSVYWEPRVTIKIRSIRGVKVNTFHGMFFKKSHKLDLYL